MQSIENRVCCLEREVRRWRVAFASILAVALVAVVVAARRVERVPEMLRARTVVAERFSVELDGRERAVLGVDDAGPDNRIPGLFLYRGREDTNVDCARFVVFGQTDEPELVLRNRDHKFQAWLQTDEKGGASLSLHDAGGAPVQTLSSVLKK